jgi:hypothetical protein
MFHLKVWAVSAANKVTIGTKTLFHSLVVLVSLAYALSTSIRYSSAYAILLEYDISSTYDISVAYAISPTYDYQRNLCFFRQYKLFYQHMPLSLTQAILLTQTISPT